MFAMYKVNEGGKWHIGTAATLEAAKARITAFAAFWPAEYTILDQETGQWSSFSAYRGEDRGNFRGGAPPKLRDLRRPNAAP